MRDYNYTNDLKDEAYREAVSSERKELYGSWHFVHKCDKCFNVVEQCPCKDCYKQLKWVKCDNCKTPSLDMWCLDIHPKEGNN